MKTETSAPVGEATPPAATELSAADVIHVEADTAGKFDAAIAEMQRYQKAFGAKGLEYFAAGKSFEESQADYVAELNKGIDERVAKLETQLAAGARVNGETAPVGFQAGDKPERKGFASKIRFAGSPKQ